KATTVRAENGKTLVTDGPYVGIKEAIGAYFIFEGDDLDAALKLAAQAPALRYGGAGGGRPAGGYWGGSWVSWGQGGAQRPGRGRRRRGNPASTSVLMRDESDPAPSRRRHLGHGAEARRGAVTLAVVLRRCDYVSKARARKQPGLELAQRLIGSDHLGSIATRDDALLDQVASLVAPKPDSPFTFEVVLVVADALDPDQVAETVARAEPDGMSGVSTATAEREPEWWSAYPRGPQAFAAA